MNDKVKTSVRLDDTVVNKLKILAKAENRSLNNIMVRLIREHVEEFEREHGKIDINK